MVGQSGEAHRHATVLDTERSAQPADFARADRVKPADGSTVDSNGTTDRSPNWCANRLLSSDRRPRPVIHGMPRQVVGKPLPETPSAGPIRGPTPFLTRFEARVAHSDLGGRPSNPPWRTAPPTNASAHPGNGDRGSGPTPDAGPDPRSPDVPCSRQGAHTGREPQPRPRPTGPFLETLQASLRLAVTIAIVSRTAPTPAKYSSDAHGPSGMAPPPGVPLPTPMRK